MLDGFSSVEYKSGASFELAKSLSHNNLVEVNINALRETFELNEIQIKEMVGNFNWKKFSDRIQEQIGANSQLTTE